MIHTLFRTVPESKPLGGFSLFRWGYRAMFLSACANICLFCTDFYLYFLLFFFLNCRVRSSINSVMAPPILSLALPSETGRVLSIQSHTVQVFFSPYILNYYCDLIYWIGLVNDDAKFKLWSDDKNCGLNSVWDYKLVSLIELAMHLGE